MEINDGNLSNAQEVGAGNVYTVFPNILFYIPVFLYIPTYSPTYLPTY